MKTTPAKATPIKATPAKATPIKAAPVKLTHRPAPVAKPKQAPVVEARLAIELQTADFLKSGGKINQIAQGVSGQLNLTGQKNIVISKKPAEKASSAQ
jgi:hypothetical protein